MNIIKIIIHFLLKIKNYLLNLKIKHHNQFWKMQELLNNILLEINQIKILN